MSIPKLDLTNIQGDVLEGLPKQHQTFLFFAIADATQFQHRLKAIIPLITTTAQVIADANAIKEHKRSGYPGLIKLAGTNIAFSHTGLTALGITDNLGDPHFSAGQLVDASTAKAGLADPGPIIGDDKTDPAWDPAFKQKIDGCILITGDSKETISERLQAIETKLAGTFKTIKEVHGRVRPGDQKGHEHFGYLDGLSQPPILGFSKPAKGEESQVTQPGVILIGEPGDLPGEPFGPTPVPPITRPPWAKDSSFLVFRKLRQFVPEFNKFVNENPIHDKGLSPSQGSDLLGARLVGRWKSGAPIDKDPKVDNPADGQHVDTRNDFDYSDDAKAQIRCPFAGHLRKTNPRASFPGLEAVKGFRIIRQGIPYGPEVDDDEARTQCSQHDRGLLFVCYQSNISKGFHFIQNTWANNPDFPEKGAGFDGIIGQDIHNQRTVSAMDPEHISTTLALPQKQFVVPLGGEYFLSPSISALKTIFAA